MKKGGGSNKGSQFERDLCKKLSLWVSEGKRDDIYWRTAGSGARATVRAKKRQCTANNEGDMCCLDIAAGGWLTDWFYFEFKRGYNNWRVDDFLCKSIFPLKTVWEDCVKKAKDVGKYPVLILKQDRREPLIFMQTIEFAPINMPLISLEIPLLRIHILDFEKIDKARQVLDRIIKSRGGNRLRRYGLECTDPW